MLSCLPSQVSGNKSLFLPELCFLYLTTRLSPASVKPVVHHLHLGIDDGLLHLLKAQAAADAGPMAEQLLRLVFGGHQHQPPLAVDACLQPRPRSQAEGIAQGPGDGELTLGGEGGGVHKGIVRRVALPFRVSGLPRTSVAGAGPSRSPV